METHNERQIDFDRKFQQEVAYQYLVKNEAYLFSNSFKTIID